MLCTALGAFLGAIVLQRMSNVLVIINIPQNYGQIAIGVVAGRKDSAEATLSISDALRCFSIRSLVAAQSNPESREIIQEIVTRRHSNFLRTDFIL